MRKHPSQFRDRTDDHARPYLGDLHANSRGLLITLREMTDQLPFNNILLLCKTEEIFHATAQRSGQSKCNRRGGQIEMGFDG
jgi:hypothetical protein